MPGFVELFLRRQDPPGHEPGQHAQAARAVLRRPDLPHRHLLQGALARSDQGKLNLTLGFLF